MTVMGGSVLDDDIEPEAMSFADQAYLVIRDKLIMLDIRPNEAIVESELAAAPQAGPHPRAGGAQTAGSRPPGGLLSAPRHVCHRGRRRRSPAHLPDPGEPRTRRGADSSRGCLRGGAGQPARSGRPDRRARRSTTSTATNSCDGTCACTARSTARRATRTSRTSWCGTTTWPPGSSACSWTDCPRWPGTSASTPRCCGPSPPATRTKPPQIALRARHRFRRSRPRHRVTGAPPIAAARQLKTTVRCPCSSTRFSQCHRTARERASASAS